MPAKQGSFANANGMLIFEDDLKEACYASLHSEPTSVLGLTTVWSLWRKTGMARCQDMSTLPAGYILQRKVPSASSIWSLGFIVSVQCCRLVDSVPIRHTISIL